MLLGKRARPPIKRTTSMSGITTVDHHHHHHHDLHHDQDKAPPTPSDHHLDENPLAEQNDDESNVNDMSLEYQKYFMSMLSPRPNSNNRITQRRNSADFAGTAHFLRTCGLCNRRLTSGHDIYMYMGDTGFCSLECREKQMKIDERKEKCNAMSSLKNDKMQSASSSKTSSVAAT